MKVHFCDSVPLFLSLFTLYIISYFNFAFQASGIYEAVAVQASFLVHSSVSYVTE